MVCAVSWVVIESVRVQRQSRSLRARLRDVLGGVGILHHGVAAAVLWVQPDLNIHAEEWGSDVLN